MQNVVYRDSVCFWCPAFVRSFVRAFVRSFVCSFDSFVRSFVRSANSPTFAAAVLSRRSWSFVVVRRCYVGVVRCGGAAVGETASLRVDDGVACFCDVECDAEVVGVSVFHADCICRLTST